MLEKRIDGVDFLIDYDISRDGEIEEVMVYVLQDSQNVYDVLSKEVQKQIDQAVWDDWEGHREDRDEDRVEDELDS